MQYIFILVIGICLYFECLNRNIGKFKIIDLVAALLVLFIIVFKFVTKHSLGTVIQRLVQVIYYLIIILICSYIVEYSRNNRNSYHDIILSYALLICKKMTQKYLIQRLKSNLQYDDITVFQLTINIYEYIIFFDRMMVQNNSEL